MDPTPPTPTGGAAPAAPSGGADSAERRMLIAAIKPVLKQCSVDARSAAGRNLRTSLVPLVHQAATLAANYGELAAFVRLGLARMSEAPTGGSTTNVDWCVHVARTVSFKLKSRKAAAAILSVPALAADLLLELEGKDKAAARALIDDALATGGYGFTVLLWKAASDDEETEAANAAALAAFLRTPADDAPAPAPAPAPAVAGGDDPADESAGSTTAAAAAPAPAPTPEPAPAPEPAEIGRAHV